MNLVYRDGGCLNGDSNCEGTFFPCRSALVPVQPRSWGDEGDAGRVRRYHGDDWDWSYEPCSWSSGTLVRYDVTMETAGPGPLSSNHSSYHPGKKGERKLICQQLQGHVTATNSVLVCVSTVHEYLLEPLWRCNLQNRQRGYQENLPVHPLMKVCYRSIAW